MTEFNTDQNPVDQLADEFAQRFRSGERPSLSEYIRKHPEHEEEIKEIFPPIAMIEQLKSRESSDRESLSRRRTGAKPVPDQIGDYDIVRELGRGGMGVVYEAKQKSLGRRVALKVLPHSAIASERQLERFHREAQSAAGLHHTNIVPVFGVGEHDGLHFYAMQYIDGLGIDEILDTMAFEGRSRHFQKGVITKDPHPDSQATKDSSHGTRANESGDAIKSASRNKAEFAQETARALRSDAFAVPRNWDKHSPRLYDTAEHTHPQTTANESPLTKRDSQTSKLLRSQIDQDDPTAYATDSTKNELDYETKKWKRDARYWKSVARIGLQAADALHYAHFHSVLHRDIKPGNLLLDSQGTVWITDFGLAKSIEQENLTATGDVIGTLRYMAPEQFEGEATHQSDIFSLGLTLFELATLRPAFDEEKRNRLIQQITQSQAPSPRSINRHVPRDLETIILKASAREASNRYASANEMVEDLQRFLNDRPVLARRTSRVEYLWRWSRRNPALSLTSSTVLVLLILVAVVTSIGNVRTRNALSRLDDEKRNVERTATIALGAQQQAEDNLNLAITAFENIFENVSSRGFAQSLEFEIPSGDAAGFAATLTEADAELLNNLLQFYERFAQQNGENTGLKEKTAEAYVRVGDIQQRLGDLERAELSYQTALQIYEAIITHDSVDAQRAVAYSQTLNRLGVLLNRSGQHHLVVQSHLRAKKFLLAQPEPITLSREYQFELAQTYSLLGSITYRGGIHGDIVIDQSKLSESLKEEMSGSSQPKESLEVPNNSRGNPQARYRFYVERNLKDALVLLTSLVERDPDNSRYRLALAQCHRNRLAIAIRFNKGPDEIRKEIQSAMSLLGELVEDFPSNPRYWYELVNTLSLSGPAFTTQAMGHDPIDRLQSAVRLATHLTEAYPYVPEYQFLLANSHGTLASLQQQGQLFEESINNYGESIERLDDLVEQYPNVIVYRFRMAQFINNLGVAQQKAGDLDQAVQTLENAADEIESMRAQGFQFPFFKRIRSNIYLNLASTHRKAGDEELAAAMQELAAEPLSKREK